jgi:hypothetical protein
MLVFILECDPRDASYVIACRVCGVLNHEFARLGRQYHLIETRTNIGVLNVGP